MKQDGQVLVSILIIIAVYVLATGTAVVASSLSKTTGISTTSDKLLYAAESGVDSALIRFLRDPNYADETISVGGISVNISVERPTPTEIIITSVATQDNPNKTVKISATIITKYQNIQY